MKPPMPYSGGKQNQAEAIANLFPDHDHYIELFGGALSVLLAKPPSKIETVNDLNRQLMTFWRVLRERPAELERVCALTPHSRDEYFSARSLDVEDELELARRVWVACTQSRGARLGVKTGWRFVHGTNRMALARYLDGYLARMAPVADRLKGVTLENRDARDLIKSFDREGALFYVDPPYLAETRHSDQYAHELSSPSEHENLLKMLLDARGHVVISGYDSELYNDLLGGWERVQFAANAMTGEKRTEIVWMNYEAPGTLFGGAA